MNLQETINLRRKMELLRRDMKTSEILDAGQIKDIDAAFGIVDVFINARQRSSHTHGQWFKVDLTGCIFINGKPAFIGTDHAGKNVCLQKNGKIYITGIGEREFNGAEN